MNGGDGADSGPVLTELTAATVHRYVFVAESPATATGDLNA